MGAIMKLIGKLFKKKPIGESAISELILRKIEKLEKTTSTMLEEVKKLEKKIGIYDDPYSYVDYIITAIERSRTDVSMKNVEEGMREVKLIDYRLVEDIMYPAEIIGNEAFFKAEHTSIPLYAWYNTDNELIATVSIGVEGKISFVKPRGVKWLPLATPLPLIMIRPYEIISVSPSPEYIVVARIQPIREVSYSGKV